MASIRGTLWEGVALRRTRAAADPDSPLRAVALPLCWDDEAGAAAALASLVPGAGPVSLPRAAEAWIARVAAGDTTAGTLDRDSAADLAGALRALLLLRRGGPGAETWRADGAPAEPRFVLNLPAFVEPDGGFDAAGYAGACAVAIRALHGLCGGRARRLRLGFADLAGMLAKLGLPYESAEARAVAAAVAALTRGAAEAESGRMAEQLGALEPVALAWPAPPAETPVPGLAEAARAALDSAAAAPGLRHAALVALAPPDAAEALLGAATGGIAPATASPVSDTARQGIRDAVAPFLHAPLPLPAAPPGEARPAPRQAPSSVRRHTGAVLHVAVGGHKVALRTAEDAEGRLVEIAFTLSKEGAAYRSLMESFAQSVSLGLRHGVPLADYVDAFAYTRFGPAGAVEGDPAIPRATSVLDWAFRRLALDYLGRRDLPQPSEEDVMPDSLGTAAQQAPLLPMDLPRVPAAAAATASPRGRRRSLRLVG
jgi:ribonucleoside-diphosphate reductase alpha chain